MRKFFLLLCLFSCQLVMATDMWVQLGSSINGENPDDSSGYSVSVSSDGLTVAIGAPHNIGAASWEYLYGHVRVYRYIGGTWTRLGDDIDGQNYHANLGYTLSLSADGNTVAIGAPYARSPSWMKGYVRIFQYDGSSWNQLGSLIEGDDDWDYSGFSVSLSSNGQRVAISATNAGSYSGGQVRVYDYNGSSSSWDQIGNDIWGLGGVTSYYEATGHSISLSDSGQIIAVGVPQFNGSSGSNSGTVMVFQYDGTSTWVQLASIEGSAVNDQFGQAVSLSGDGQVFAAGVKGSDINGDNSGYVRAYKNIGGTWTQIGTDILGDSLGDQSGELYEIFRQQNRRPKS